MCRTNSVETFAAVFTTLQNWLFPGDLGAHFGEGHRQVLWQLRRDLRRHGELGLPCPDGSNPRDLAENPQGLGEWLGTIALKWNRLRLVF